jgi:glycosyltransferase involved in cell wall biosynthesis
MPHVCFVNRVYPPASGATGALLAELAPALVDRGWRVTILTGPAEGAPASEVTGEGVHVERVGALPFTRESTWRRGLAYASLFPAFLAGALRLPAPDVIVTKTDPPMLKVLGPLLGRLTGARTVHWAQDLYPEVAEGVGVIAENGLLARGMRGLSTGALRGHDHVVAVGRCMRDRLVQDRGLPAERVTVSPNWPPASVHPVPHEENAFRAEHGLDDRFVVMYSGNMGLAHPFDAVLDAAARLQDARPSVCVLFVGEGPRKADLQRQVERRGLDNVRFLPFQPRERLAESLSAADLHLVTMQSALEGLVVPSKLYGALGAGRPALFLGPPGSEAARVVQERDCGTVLSDPDGTALANTITDWHQAPDRWAAACDRAHAAVADGFADAVERFDDLLRPTSHEDVSVETSR